MQTNKTIRLFISSTFSDFKEERNYLQENIFPGLRSLCMRYGATLHVIDLRWGVSEEAGLDQKTIQICLDEIARCQRVSPRPNFVVLLGDRYGWQPIPARICKDEFISIHNFLSAHHPDAGQLLEEWYQYDANAVPTEFYLKPRKGKFSHFRKWVAVEEFLRDKLRLAVRAVGIDDDASQKYFLSATGQEILRGALAVPKNIPDPSEHVFCFFRSISDLPKGNQASDASAFIDLDSAGNRDAEAKKLLEELKIRLGKLPSKNIHQYHASWIGHDISLDHVQKFCSDIGIRLEHVISEQLVQLEGKSELQTEIDLHEDFRNERILHFFGRDNLIDEIGLYFKNRLDQVSKPLILHGSGGTGKSSLMAKVSFITSTEVKNAAVIYRFIGISPGATSGKSLLNSICLQIAEIYDWKEYKSPSSLTEQSDLFQKALSFATPQKPLILILDAADQLSDADNARKLTWVPLSLPPYVKMLLSTLKGECFDTLRSLLPGEAFRKIDPLSTEEGRQILNAWLQQAGRTLQPEQEQKILQQFNRQGRPLYLKLAFEEAKNWKSEDRPILEPGINAMIRKLFQRLSRESNHGYLIVSRCMAYIAVAKNGLGEAELMDVLSQDSEVLADFKRRSPKSPVTNKLPVVIWSRLYFDLEPFLVERNADGMSLFGFFHRQFGQVVRNMYLPDKTREKLHSLLASYFLNQDYYLDGDAQKLPNLRKLNELPYHLIQASLFDDLTSLLSEPLYLKAKLDAGLSSDLFDELHDTFNNLRKRELASSDIKPISPQLPKTLFKLFTATGGINNDLINLEDIHAALIYRPEKDFYKAFLNLGSDEKTRNEYCDSKSEFSEDIDITFTIRLANMQRRDGDLDGAMQRYNRILPALVAKHALKQELARAYYDIGYIDYLSGRFAESIENILKSADVALEAGDEIGHWISREVAGFIKNIAALGTINQQAALLEFMNTCNNAYEVFAKYQSVNATAERFVTNTNAHRLIIAFHLNDYKTAKRFFDAQKNDPWMMRQRITAKPLIAMTRLAMLRGRFDLAIRYLEEYIEPIEKTGNRMHLLEAFAETYYLYGTALAKSGRLADAKTAWQKGILFPDKPGNHKWKELIKMASGLQEANESKVVH